jgi:DNA replication protein DnaC
MNTSDTKVRDAHCDRHGAFESHNLFRDHWSICPACQDEQREQAEHETLAARHAEFVASATARSGVLGRFMGATFETFTATTQAQRRALITCQDFSVGAERGDWATLVLLGPPGTGKTHLAAAIVLDAIQRGKRARYITFRDLIRELRATWRRNAEASEEEVISDLASVPLLVVDEVGVSMGSEAELVQFFDVIDRRYQLSNPLVLVSNLNVPDLNLALGDRLADRIRENSTVVSCNWASHRSSGAANNLNHPKGN